MSDSRSAIGTIDNTSTANSLSDSFQFLAEAPLLCGSSQAKVRGVELLSGAFQLGCDLFLPPLSPQKNRVALHLGAAHSIISTWQDHRRCTHKVYPFQLYYTHRRTRSQENPAALCGPGPKILSAMQNFLMVLEKLLVIECVSCKLSSWVRYEQSGSFRMFTSSGDLT